MKYSVCAQRRGGDEMSAGHSTAASAIAGVIGLKGEGASHIQIFDIKTGRLVDEAALGRADVQDRLMAARRPPVHLGAN